MDVIGQGTDGDAAELLAGGSVEKEGLAVLRLIGLLDRGDSQAVRAHGDGVDLLVAASRDDADLVRRGRIRGVEDVDFAGVRVDGEDALRRGVESDDFRGGLTKHARVVGAERLDLERGVGDGVDDGRGDDGGLGRNGGDGERGRGERAQGEIAADGHT